MALQQDDVTVGFARWHPGIGQQHHGQQADDLRLVGHQGNHDQDN